MKSAEELKTSITQITSCPIEWVSRARIPGVTPLFVSPARAASVIGIGRTKLFELLGRGEIKALKLGARTLIPLDELLRYLDGLPAAEFRGCRKGA